MLNCILVVYIFDINLYITNILMYYKRKIEKNILSNLENNKVVILTGMRRVGKTTLLKQVFNNLPDNKVWFDFENPLDIKYFEDIDYNDIYQNILNKGLSKKERIYVFIDEVQHYGKISKIVKYLVDHYNVKFILTGSASYYLKNLFPESLAGRKVIFEMFPLDFEEFLEFKKEDLKKYYNIKNKQNKVSSKAREDGLGYIKELDYEIYDKYYEEFIEWGSFPEVVLQDNIKQKKILLEDIFSSYFQNEIVNLADYRKNYKIRDLILLLAARVGSQLDLVKLSQELQINRTTLYSYLSFLQATYFIHLISRFSKSTDVEVSGSQKIYFCDNGILQSMAKINEGQLFENAIYNQLKRNNKINYYKNRSGAEIDFIINQDIAYEVKVTATVSDINRLKRRMKFLKLMNGFVISKNYVDTRDSVKYGQFL